MTWERRRKFFPVVGVAIGGFMVWGFTGLPRFGDFNGTYGRVLTRVAVAQRHTTNVVAAIVFDYRGLDTLGEEFILFTSVIGVAFLLRGSKRSKEQVPNDAESGSATRLIGMLMTPVTVVLALWLAAYGYVTPGGGFQGGVALSSAAALVWATSSYRNYHDLTPLAAVDGFEGFGASAYVVTGLLGLLIVGAYLGNFLGFGVSGTLESGGSIAILNWASAIEVAAANILIYREFFTEYIQTLPDAKEE